MADGPILVTGAASGIGAATVAVLLAAGTDVIGLDLQAPPAGTGPASSARYDHVECDLADADAIDALDLPPLGGLAHVAGVPGTHPPERVLRVNLLSARRLASRTEITHGGAIVNVASVAQFRSPVDADRVQALLDADDAALLEGVAELDGTQAYDFSKQALVALTKRQARDRLADGVRAVSVSPGPTETPILEDFRASMGADRMDAAAAVVGRHGRAEDIAPVIAFLLSEQARWVNAVDLLVDGGLLGVR